MNHSQWDGLLNHPTESNKVYFFVADQCYLYDWSAQAVDSAYPQTIASIWPGVPDAIDGALNHPTDNNKVYFFKGKEYYRYDTNNDNGNGAVDTGYPKAIKGIWGNITGNIDAAVNHPSNNSKVYLFKRTIYYRNTWGISANDSGYPKDIGNIYFKNIPHHLDGAAKHPSLANKVLLVKQNLCYQFDWGTGLDAGWPKPVSEVFPGLPESTAPVVVAGPLCSAVTETTASIWLWCGAAFNREQYTLKLNGQVYTDYSSQAPDYTADTASQQQVTNAIGQIVPGSEIITLNLSGLSTATDYHFELCQGTGQLAALTFKTAPAENVNSSFKLMLGSCSDTTVHLDAPVYQQMAAQNADLLLMAGDNSYYYDAPEITTSKGTATADHTHDWSNAEMMLRRQLKARQQGDFNTVLQNTPVLSVWDDHDFGYNNAKGGDSDSGWAGKEVAANVYRAMWNNPYTAGKSGIYYDTRQGPAHIFMTDGRYYKGVGASDTLLGSEQLNWLINGLRQSKALLKIVVFGGRMLRTTSGGERFSASEGLTSEALAEYNALRDALGTVGDDEITGAVLLLSGDIHFSDCYTFADKADESGLLKRQKALEVTSSPLRLNSKHAVTASSTDSANQRLFSGNGESFALLDITLNFDPDGANQIGVGSQIDIQILDAQGERLANAQNGTIALSDTCHCVWDLQTGAVNLD